MQDALLISKFSRISRDTQQLCIFTSSRSQLLLLSRIQSRYATSYALFSEKPSISTSRRNFKQPEHFRCRRTVTSRCEICATKMVVIPALTNTTHSCDGNALLTYITCVSASCYVAEHVGSFFVGNHRDL